MKAQNTEKFEMNILTNGQETPITSDMIKATLQKLSNSNKAKTMPLKAA